MFNKLTRNSFQCWFVCNGLLNMKNKSEQPGKKTVPIDKKLQRRRRIRRTLYDHWMVLALSRNNKWMIILVNLLWVVALCVIAILFSWLKRYHRSMCFFFLYLEQKCFYSCSFHCWFAHSIVSKPEVKSQSQMAILLRYV